jgi:GntR family transcriptional regulator
MNNKSMETHLKLDFRNKTTISEQVQNEMRRAIQNGILRPGDQLPTVRALAAQLKVNFNTVARAYRTLDQEGLISTQQGRGTYVLDSTAPNETTAVLSTKTKEERVNDLVREMIEKASSEEISTEELLQAYLRHKQKYAPTKIQTRNHIKRNYPKKRVYAPAGDRGWVKIKAGPGLKKPRRIQKTK